jgi:hypothetical protein
MAYAILVYKRSVEPSPRRPYKTWLLDISKQGFSSLLIHSWNVFSAMIFSKHQLPNDSGDECAFYVINYALDTCCGIFLIWSFLLSASRFAYHAHIPSIQIQGNYGTTHVCTWYFQQLAVFLGAITLSKSILSCVEYVGGSALRSISRWLFAQFHLSDDIELVLSLIVLPFFMGMSQVFNIFWYYNLLNACELPCLSA